MKVNIHAAKTTLSRLIERAHAGDDIVIARGKIPVARLIPVTDDAPERRPGTLKGLVSMTAAFFEPLPDEELDAWEMQSEAPARHARAAVVGNARRRAASARPKRARRSKS